MIKYEYFSQVLICMKRRLAEGFIVAGQMRGGGGEAWAR